MELFSKAQPARNKACFFCPPAPQLGDAQGLDNMGRSGSRELCTNMENLCAPQLKQSGLPCTQLIDDARPHWKWRTKARFGPRILSAHAETRAQQALLFFPPAPQLDSFQNAMFELNSSEQPSCC
jgi:hypothetical protein